MKQFPGVYPESKMFRAYVNLPEGKYHLGTYLTPEKAFLKVRLFKHWVKIGYHPDDIPRLYKEEVIEAPYHELVSHERIESIIRSKGSISLTENEMLNIATELVSLRVLRYGSTRTTKIR